MAIECLQRQIAEQSEKMQEQDRLIRNQMTTIENMQARLDGHVIPGRPEDSWRTLLKSKIPVAGFTPRDDVDNWIRLVEHDFGNYRHIMDDVNDSTFANYILTFGVRNKDTRLHLTNTFESMPIDTRNWSGLKKIMREEYPAASQKLQSLQELQKLRVIGNNWYQHIQNFRAIRLRMSHINDFNFWKNALINTLPMDRIVQIPDWENLTLTALENRISSWEVLNTHDQRNKRRCIHKMDQPDKIAKYRGAESTQSIRCKRCGDHGHYPKDCKATRERAANFQRTDDYMKLCDELDKRKTK